MNNWKYGFLLFFGCVLIAYGVLMLEIIENNCNLKHEDWRRRLITFVTSLIIGFGFFGMIVYTTVQHFEYRYKDLESYDFGKTRHGLVIGFQILIGLMLVIYGPLVISVIINNCDLEIDDWRKILINGIAFLTGSFGLFLIVVPLWNKYAKAEEFSYTTLSTTRTTSGSDFSSFDSPSEMREEYESVSSLGSSRRGSRSSRKSSLTLEE